MAGTGCRWTHHDQQPVPGPQIRGENQVRHDGARHLGQSRGPSQIDTRRNRQHLRSRHRHLLGIPTAGDKRTHLIADAPPIGTRPEGTDPPLTPPAPESLRRPSADGGPTPLQQVSPVHPAATTSITTSPGPTGSGTSDTDRDSVSATAHNLPLWTEPYSLCGPIPASSNPWPKEAY